MIKEKINKELKDSMLNGNKTKTATLRLVLSAIKDKEILERTKNSEEEIGDNAILDILTKMVKQRIESSDIFTKNERLDLAKKEDEEIIILRDYMPKQMTEDETLEAIKKSVHAVNASSLKDMGKIMGELKSNYSGQIDFSLAGKLVKEILS